MITISNSHRNVHDLYSTTNTRVTRRVPLVEQELPTFPEHLCSALFLVWCAFCLKCCVQTIACPFCFVNLLSPSFNGFWLPISYLQTLLVIYQMMQYFQDTFSDTTTVPPEPETETNQNSTYTYFVVYLWNVWKKKKNWKKIEK